MSTNTNFKQTQVSKIDRILSGVVCLVTALLLISTISIKQNSDIYDKSAQAAGANTGNLIIGTKDTGSAIELSVCVQATPGPIHLTNLSTWFQYDTTALTPTAGSFLEKGKYNGTDGYGQLKWNQVAGSLSGNLDKYTMNLAFSGDEVSAGQAGLLMSSATPELIGRVSFAKITGSTASSSITLAKNIFYSTENTTTPIVQTVSNLTGDCRGASTSNASSSLVSSSSLLVSSISSTSSSVGTVNNGGSGSGGGVIVICAASCSTANPTTPQQSNPSNANPTTNQNNIQSTNPAPVASTNKQNGVFKSKLHITDPYVCGDGAYGNVFNPKQNGVDYVYYEFYKNGATTSSYNYKLRMNENGDFYLPISKSTNDIADGNYRIVFYAYDSEGNKAQGEYPAQIAANCATIKTNNLSNSTVRTGGLQILQFILLVITIASLIRFYKLSKTQEITLKM